MTKISSLPKPSKCNITKLYLFIFYYSYFFLIVLWITTQCLYHKETHFSLSCIMNRQRICHMHPLLKTGQSGVLAEQKPTCLITGSHSHWFSWDLQKHKQWQTHSKGEDLSHVCRNDNEVGGGSAAAGTGLTLHSLKTKMLVELAKYLLWPILHVCVTCSRLDQMSLREEHRKEQMIRAATSSELS